MTNIGLGAFERCTSLASVTIPASVTTIGGFAFSSCTSLTDMTIQNGVTSIGEAAFQGCKGLTNITLPASMTEIGKVVFNAPNLTDIYVDSSSKSYTSVDGVLFSLDMTEVVCYPQGKPAVSYDIPKTVKTIDDSAFMSCRQLRRITIPDGVTTIGELAFSGCTSLTSMTIPDGVTSIGLEAFYDCTALTSVTIPASVTTIGEDAFDACDSLTIRGHANSAAQRYAEENFISFVDLEASPSGSCGENIQWSFSDGTLTISGTGLMEEPGYQPPDKPPWYAYHSLITKVEIMPGVTSIRDFAFMDCEQLQSVTIPASVTSIGTQAFFYCTSLPSVTIPDSVTSIGNGVFSYCTSLADVTLPDSVTEIGETAFERTPWLANIVWLIRNGTLYAYGGPGGNVTIPPGPP